MGNGMWGSESSFVAPSKHMSATLATATARSAAEVDGTDASMMEEPDQKYQPNTFMLEKDKAKGKSDDPGFALLAFPITSWLVIFVALFIYNSSQSPAPAPMPPLTMPPPTIASLPIPGAPPTIASPPIPGA